MLNLPLSYIFLRFGAIPEIVMIVAIIVSQLCLIERVILLRRMIQLPAFEYLKKVYLNVVSVMLLSTVIPVLLSRCLQETFFSFLILSIVSVVITGMIIFYVGFQTEERYFMITRIKNFKRKMFGV